MGEIQTETVASSRRAPSGVVSMLARRREILLLGVLLALLTGVSLRVPGYLRNNYMNILKGGSINMVMAAGMLPVLLIGSIDISVASTLAFSGAVAGMLMRDGYIVSTIGMVLTGIAIGGAIGALNGVLVAYGRVLPIIVTLGMGYVTRAMIPMDWLLGLNKIARINLTDSFKVFFLDHYRLGLPYLVWFAVVVTLLTGLFLRFTRIGRRVYAVGSNESAALVRGVHTGGIKTLAHAICGAASGLAGVMWLGYYNSVEKTTASGDEMYVIAACVLGGVAVTGGYGKITGVVIGALMIAMINSAIPQLNVGNSMITEFVKGLLLLAAILLNAGLRRFARRRELLGRRV
ncbi:MAG: ABC transporter permease [Oscillospiraceae bacterium]|jgi:rhamnose transport system permease protein|nr:ABC transporter permease [Oscillospiraceae bacterium]